VAGRVFSLGGFRTQKEAAQAYESARIRARLGEPIGPRGRELPSVGDIARWYQPPAERIYFGEETGEIVALVEPDQEQSGFLMHDALQKLHPIVRKFVLVASDTGDLVEAASAAGLNQAQVATILPRLRDFLRPMLQ